jgi:hypothetical protein
VDRQPYGRIGDDNGCDRIVLVHRVAWELTNGPIPLGQCVLHRCDNPPCCNPKHLFLGTQDDNMADMASKGRGVGRPKISDTEADEIRSLRQNGVMVNALARGFDISREQVYNITHGISHLSGRRIFLTVS